MLLTREEMTFDFGGARFEPERDRKLLEWMLNQFLYGELTANQVGYWLYRAPDLEAGRFFARQAVEEYQHVDQFMRIQQMLGCAIGPPHPMVKFLAKGMMGRSFADHVALEMATGEGFVLMALYGLIDTLNQAETVEILRRIARQEERHVEFGEQRTMQLLRDRRWLRFRIRFLHGIWLWGVRRLAKYMRKRLPSDHPVLRQLPQFLEKSLLCSRLRMKRMGTGSPPVIT